MPVGEFGGLPGWLNHLHSCILGEYSSGGAGWQGLGGRWAITTVVVDDALSAVFGGSAVTAFVVIVKLKKGKCMLEHPNNYLMAELDMRWWRYRVRPREQLRIASV